LLRTEQLFTLETHEAQEERRSENHFVQQRTEDSRYNDIDLSRWKDYRDIYTDSLWLIDSRDRSNGHKLDYHGNYIPQIAAQTLTGTANLGT